VRSVRALLQFRDLCWTRMAAGLLVPHGDRRSIAIRTATTQPLLVETVERTACDLVPTLSWSSVAGQYAAASTGLVEFRQHMTV
jgi:hypothetical protein